MTPNPRYSPLGSGYIIELSVACYFADGGGAGFWLKSIQSVMPSAAASRAFSVFEPKIVSQNLTRLTCECSVFEMYPAIIASRKSGGVQTGRQRRKVMHRISMGIVDNGRVRGDDHQVTRSGGPRNIREVVVAESELACVCEVRWNI
jgi:hypothetical protein